MGDHCFLIMLPVISGIYAIRCLANGCVYVGQAANCRTRFNGHKHHLRRNKHGNPRLQNAWNAHGEAAFEFVVLEACDVSELTRREQFHLDFFRGCGAVFNAGLAADCPARGRKFGPQSEAVKKARSDALKGRPRSEEHRRNLSTSLRGRVTSEEVKAKQRAAKVGRKLSSEHRAKLSAAKLGKPHPVNENARRRLLERNSAMKHTPAALEKMRLASLGRTHTPETRAKCAAAAKRYWADKRQEHAA